MPALRYAPSWYLLKFRILELIKNMVGYGRQHLSLRRDVEVVMVNALMPWGNGCLLPLGPLREPFAALCNADILVIHHADLVFIEYSLPPFVLQRHIVLLICFEDK